MYFKSASYTCETSVNDISNQFDNVIKKHSGERLFFFKNLNEYKKWSNEVLGIPINTKELISQEEQIRNSSLVAFIEPNGQISLSTGVYTIKHPNNPFYDKEVVETESLSICQTTAYSPNLSLYLIEHNLIPEGCLNDLKGDEHGRLLFQENIEFLVRCLRRDISRTDVYHKRNKELFLDESKFKVNTPEGKMPFADFAKALFDEKRIYSVAHKEWIIESCNMNVTVVKDVANDNLHYLPTKKLYEAHIALPAEKTRVSDLIPYVGRADASAASAVLYNTVGVGRNYSSIRKLASYFSQLTPEELEKLKDDFSKE